MENSQKIDELMQTLKDSLTAGCNKKAIKTFRELVNLLPCDPKLVKKRVKELLKIGRWDPI